jgi:hypothetical protein
MTRLCFDYDPILYTCGAIGETRSIRVVHRESGDEYEFPNRTAFWGHHKKKAGGYLAEWNSAKSEAKQRKPEEFDITDVQEPEPIANAIYTMKRTIQGIKEAVEADDGYYGYSGRGEVFRVDVSTVIKYKGNRDGLLKPFHLEDLKDYVVKHQGCTIVEKIEADDACSMDNYEAFKKWKKSQKSKDKLVLAGVDKDYYGCEGFFYNTMEAKGVVTIDGLGSLRIETREVSGRKISEVKGHGRMWLYFQTLNGDDADNYFANSANPDVKWGAMTAYNLLKDCKTDKEALQALVEGYKTLYPSPRKIIGWRGYEDPKDMTILKPNHKDFEIEVDAMYMLRENFTLARMLRWPEDHVDIKSVLDKQGVMYQ